MDTLDLSVSDEERELLVASTRRLFAQRWPVEGAPDRAARPESLWDIWRSMSEQGLTTLGNDRAQGGLREIILVFQEMGRASCPAPLMGAIVFNLLLRDAAKVPPAFASLRSALHDGTASVAVGFGAFDGDQAAGDIRLSNGRLEGSVSFVENTQTCTHLLLFLQEPACAAIVPINAAGVSVDVTPGLAVPALANVTFHNVVLKPESILDAGESTLANLVQAARLCCAARAIGAAARGLELAVEHAKVRRQFGQLIGQFQAIQHKLVDCLTRIDGARLTLDAAATAFDLSMPDWQTFAAASVAYSGPALRQTALEAHHALGAIGYAEEHEMPRHFRRIHADVARFGGVSKARAELADYLLGPANNQR